MISNAAKMVSNELIIAFLSDASKHDKNSRVESNDKLDTLYALGKVCAIVCFSDTQV